MIEALAHNQIGLRSETEARMKMPTVIDRDFVRRLIRAFPEDQYALQKLIGISKIAFDDNVPTCCIYSAGRPVIAIGTGFYKKYIDTFAKLAFLIHHEVMHKIMGHLDENIQHVMTQYDLKATGLQGLIKDLVIQGIAYQVMPGKNYQAMNRIYYGGASWPHSLLYHGNRHDTFIANKIMRLIYSPIGVTYDKLIELLTMFDVEKPMVINRDEVQDSTTTDGKVMVRGASEDEDIFNRSGASGDEEDQDEESGSEQDDEPTPATQRDTDAVPEGEGDILPTPMLFGDHGDNPDPGTMSVQDILDAISKETEAAMGGRDEAIQEEINRQREIMLMADIPPQRIELELDAAKEGWGMGGSPYLMDLQLGRLISGRVQSLNDSLLALLIWMPSRNCVELSSRWLVLRGLSSHFRICGTVDLSHRLLWVDGMCLIRKSLQVIQGRSVCMWMSLGLRMLYSPTPSG